MVTKSKQVIIRLSRYKRALNRFKSLGFVKIFSDYLADSVGSTPSQVRKDFSLFAITGNKRGGYIIDELIEKLNTILGKDIIQNVIIVGAGNIGMALIGYSNFERESINISAVFDIDPAKCKKTGDVPVLPCSKVESFVKKNKVELAIIAVPEMAAQQVFDNLIRIGVRGIMNFAPIILKAPDWVVVNNVNLAVELENVVYFINASKKRVS